MDLLPLPLPGPDPGVGVVPAVELDLEERQSKVQDIVLSLVLPCWNCWRIHWISHMSLLGRLRGITRTRGVWRVSSSDLATASVPSE